MVQDLVVDAFEFIESVGTLNAPMAIVLALHRVAARHPGLGVHGLWMLPWRYTDFDRWQIGVTAFFHPDVSDDYFSEIKALTKAHNGSALSSYARSHTGPFTVTHAMHKMRLTGEDFWIIDFLHKHGIRDGIYCPMRTWAALYRSNVVVRISASELFALHVAAVAAARRLDELTRELRAQQTHLDPLTPREIAVARLLRAGITRGKIAGELGIEQDTVRSHIRNMMRKLKATTTEQAVAEALSRRWIA